MVAPRTISSTCPLRRSGQVDASTARDRPRRDSRWRSTKRRRARRRPTPRSTCEVRLFPQLLDKNARPPCLRRVTSNQTARRHAEPSSSQQSPHRHWSASQLGASPAPPSCPGGGSSGSPESRPTHANRKSLRLVVRVALVTLFKVSVSWVEEPSVSVITTFAPDWTALVRSAAASCACVIDALR